MDAIGRIQRIQGLLEACLQDIAKRPRTDVMINAALAALNAGRESEELYGALDLDGKIQAWEQHSAVLRTAHQIYAATYEWGGKGVGAPPGVPGRPHREPPIRNRDLIGRSPEQRMYDREHDCHFCGPNGSCDC